MRRSVPAGFTAFGADGTALPFPVLAVPEPRAYALLVAGLGVVIWAAVVAVPEPRTYALFVAGLGLVALTVRRRAGPWRT